MNKKISTLIAFLVITFLSAASYAAPLAEIQHPKDGATIKSDFLNLHVLADDFPKGVELVQQVKIIDLSTNQVIFESEEPIGIVGGSFGMHVNTKIRDSLPSSASLKIEVGVILDGTRYAASPIQIYTK